MTKKSIATFSLMIVAALVVVVGIPSMLTAGGPAPQVSRAQASPDVSAMFKEIQKELAVIRAELAEIKTIVSGKPELAATPDEKAALQLAKDFVDAAGINPNIEKVMGLVDTPFLYPEDNKIIKNRAELRKLFKGASENIKGEDDIVVMDFRFEIAKSLKLNSKAQKLVDEVAPNGGIIVKGTSKIFGEEVATFFIIVRASGKPKIVGGLAPG